MIALSCGIKISAVRHLVLSQSTRVTDRQTDGQTDRITTPKTAVAYARAVKIQLEANCSSRYVVDFRCSAIDVKVRMASLVFSGVQRMFNTLAVINVDTYLSPIKNHWYPGCVVNFLARDGFVRTNRRATIAITFVRLSVRLGRACIVIIRCTLSRI